MPRKACRSRQLPCRTKWIRIRTQECRHACGRRNMKSGSSGTTWAQCLNRMVFPPRPGLWTTTTPCGPEPFADWTSWGQTFAQAARHWCQALSGWNLALDEKGRPNIGPFPCGGMVTIHSQTKEITRSGQYWAFAHFSRHVRRGARRFDSTCKLAGVDQVAFQNQDGQNILVVTNSGPAKAATLTQAGKTAELTLAPDSLTTLSWK